MLESEKIYRRYVNQHLGSEDKFEPDVSIDYDHQFKDTVDSIIKHKKSVKRRLLYIADKIRERAEAHDNSKLNYPELGWLVAMDKEGRAPYGSEEYFEKQKRWECFFKHHYSENTHHPDHYDEGTKGMSVVDIVEMMCDVISYLDEIPQEKVFEVISEQAERFGFSSELKAILTNTLLLYFAKIADVKPDYNPKNYIGKRT